MGTWLSPDPAQSKHMHAGGNTRGVFSPQNLALLSYAWNNPVVIGDTDGRDVIILGGITHKGPQFRDAANKLASQLVDAGIPRDHIQMMGIGSGSVGAAAQKIEASGRTVSTFVFAGHGAPGQIATDAQHPGDGSASLSSLAKEAKVQKGGVAVALSCLTCAFGRETREEKEACGAMGVGMAGFDKEIGFVKKGALEVPLDSGKFVSPGEVVPPGSTGPDAGKNVIQMIVGAERRTSSRSHELK